MSLGTSIDVLTFNHPVLNALLYGALLVGVVKVTLFGLLFLSLLLDLFVLPKTDFSVYKSGSENWAIVTGASDGLGKQFAQQLADKGFNILLVARNEDKLRSVASELKTKSEIFLLDFSERDQDRFDEKLAELRKFILSRKLNVSVLINNVGVLHLIPVPFEETSKQELENIIYINCLGTIKFTQLLLPVLETTKGKLLVLTVGSFSGLLPSPLLATYSGSKAFLQNWLAALASEVQDKNIEVYALLAYLITSKMLKVRRSSFLIPSEKSFVRAALANFKHRCGAQERYMTCTPYWSHALMHWGIESTVGVYLSLANKINLSMHRGIRARALRKKAKKGE